jgi:hypothetical protein
MSTRTPTFVGRKELAKIVADVELGVKGNPEFTVSCDALQQLLIGCKKWLRPRRNSKRSRTLNPQPSTKN